MRATSRIRAGSLTVTMILALVSPAAFAMEWDLSGAARIDLDGVSGDVVIRPADRGAGRVELRADVYPRDAFRPVVEQDGATLRIEEDWNGSSSGKVEWTFYVPPRADLEIAIDTASGSLDCENVSVSLDFDSASGDIELRDVDLLEGSGFSTASGDFRIEDMTVRRGVSFSTASGDIDLRNVEVEGGVSFSTASGDVKAQGCRGHLKLSTASGDVVVEDSTLFGEGRFSSASGDVSLHLDGVPGDGLSASSASGNVVLDAGALGGSFTLVMVADQKKGRIDCPFGYTYEGTFERNRRTYDEKRVERGSGGPQIELETSSGAVIVRGR